MEVQAEPAECPALGDDDAVRSTLGHLDLAVREWDLFLSATTAFSVSRPIPPNNNLGLALDRREADRPGRALNRSTAAVVEGEHVVLDGLDQEQPLELMQLLRLLRREVVRLASSRLGAVQLPHVIVEGRQALSITHGVL